MKTETIVEIINDSHEHIVAFIKVANLTFDDYGKIVHVILEKNYPQTDFFFEEVSSVDVGPAGNVDTYMLGWIDDHKLQKIMFTADVDGSFCME